MVTSALRRTTAVLALTCAAVVTLAGVAAADPAPETTTMTGVVQELVVEDPHGDHHGDVEKVLRVGEEIVDLAAGSLPRAENGDTVRATLAETPSGEQRVVAATEVAAAPAETADPAMHDVHVALVVPAGVTPDPALTGDAVAATVNRASAYWSSQTNGNVKFRVTQVLPEYTSTLGCADGTEAIWDEVLAKTTIPTTANQHLLVVVPAAAQAQGCDYGLGSIGTWTGYPGLTFISSLNQSIVAHELGHNLGLHHSGALHCGTQDPAYTVVNGSVVWPASCTPEEYGDLLDVMGYSGETYGEGSLNAAHLDRMGYLPGAVQTITAAGTTSVRIAPLSASPTAVRAVKVVTASGERYYAEYRTDSGLDHIATVNGWRPSLGVRVLRQNPERATSSPFVLDATPTGPTQLDAYGYENPDYTNKLAVGATFTSAGAVVQVRVEAADAAGATLTIANGTSLPPVGPATAVVSGLPGTAIPGTALTAALAVTGKDGTPVSGWAADLQAAPSGSTAYRTVATARTTSAGKATHAFTAPADSTSYRWVTAAQTGMPSVTSKAVTVTARRVPSVVTLTGVSPKVAAGTAISGRATVTDVVTRAVPGWTVQLQAQQRGTTTYRVVQTAKTDAKGVASFRVTHGVGATYRAVTVGQPGVPVRAGRAVVVTSQAKVSLRKPASTAKRNRTLATGGSISAVPSAVVYVQTRYGSGKWVTAGRATVRGTAVTGPVKLTRKGTYQVRYVLVSEARYLGGTSRAYSVKIS